MNTNENKVSFFQKIVNLGKQVLKTAWNFVKGCFGSWKAAAQTLAITALFIGAEVVVPGISIFLLAVGAVVLFALYMSGMVVKAWQAAAFEIAHKSNLDAAKDTKAEVVA
jgi:hypothetical protein